MQRGKKISVVIRREGSRWNDGSCHSQAYVYCTRYFEGFEHSEELLNEVVPYVQEFYSSLLHPVF